MHVSEAGGEPRFSTHDGCVLCTNVGVVVAQRNLSRDRPKTINVQDRIEVQKGVNRVRGWIE